MDEQLIEQLAGVEAQICRCGHALRDHRYYSGLLICCDLGDTATKQFQGGMTCNCLNFVPLQSQPNEQNATLSDEHKTTSP